MCLRIANPAINRVGSGGRAGRIRIDGSELLLEEAPVDRCCELHHWMIKVDDLVEPRPEEIALPRLPTFLRPHESPRRRPQRSQGITARTPHQFARKPIHNGRNPANTITSRSPKLTADQELGSFSRTTSTYAIIRPCSRGRSHGRTCLRMDFPANPRFAGNLRLVTGSCRLLGAKFL